MVFNIPKLFHCSKCGEEHRRPVGNTCQLYVESTSSTSTTVSGQNADDSSNAQILSALNAVSCRLSAIEQRIDRTEEQLQDHVKTGSDIAGFLGSSSTPFQDVDEDSDAGDDVVIPSAKFLKSSKNIQDAVDIRLQELAKLNEQGKFKSQRGNNDQVTVKQQIPWPQNYILSGTSKSRVTYDSLSSFQWMAGFSAIIREEKNVKIKNAMLEYMTDIMEDAQDFGWATAKGAHALILCRMEEGKVDWLSSKKLDRLRGAHAQKIVTNTGANSNSLKNRTEAQGVPCKFYQSAKCSHKNDHTTSGQLYRHICSHCFSLGKKFAHPLKDCRNKHQQDAKNE